MLGYSLARVRPQGALRRKGALDTARRAGHDSLFGAGSGRAAGEPFRRGLPRRLGPGRTLPPTRSNSLSGRSVAAVFAVPRQWDRGVVGPLRHGLRTVFRSRFHSPARLSQPRRFHRARGLADHLRPDARPGTQRPKHCWGCAASPIPCAQRQPRSICLPRRRFRQTTSHWSTTCRGQGLHPYHLPMACDYTDGCSTCQGYLCHQSCKNDAARNALLPALAEHGAQLLTECRVVRLDADRTQVRQVICEHALAARWPSRPRWWCWPPVR